MEPGAALATAIRDAGGGDRDAPAIAFAGTQRSRDWLHDRIAWFDDALAGYGGVGLVARNRPLHVAAVIANLAGGRGTTMIASGRGAGALADTVRTFEGEAIVAEQADWTGPALAAAAQAGIAAIATDEDAGPRMLQPARRPAGHAPFAGPALELLSSGTTGPPKRIGLSWRTVAHAVADAAAAYAGSDRPGAQVMVHPLGNISGLAYAVPPVVHRQPLVLLDRFTAHGWAAAVREHRPRRGAVPPAGIAMLLDADIPGDWLDSLDLIAVGGGRLDAALHDAFEARYRIPVLTAYGATEFGGVIANWSLDAYRASGRAKRGSAGRAGDGVTLRIVDPRGRTLGPGETGLLEARVPRIGGDWIRTTDLARIDADGFLFIEGRADGAINRGGFTIVPETVADALRAHPAVRDAAVVALPDARLGEVPVAMVEAGTGGRPDPAALDAWLRDRLAPWQVPTAILVVDALPRTATLKISLSEVRTALAAALR